MVLAHKPRGDILRADIGVCDDWYGPVTRDGGRVPMSQVKKQKSKMKRGTD